MFCNLMNISQPINNNQCNVVGERMLIFLKMDPKYSENNIIYKLLLNIELKLCYGCR